MKKIQYMQNSMGYRKFQITSVRNCRVNLQDMEHNTMAKVNHLKKKPMTILPLQQSLALGLDGITETLPLIAQNFNYSTSYTF